VRRTAGAAASFIKELARRAALAVLRNGTSVEHELASSLDATLDQSAPVLRRSLAAPAGDEALDRPAHGQAP
jgi:predicted phosphoribosyltransferase